MNTILLIGFPRKRLFLPLACLLLAAAVSVRASVFLVLNTQNGGDNSLRWALDQANANPGPDTIRFAIPKTDPGFDGTVWTIKPQSGLPWISSAGTFINGGFQTTVANSNPTGPEVFIDGRDAGTSTSGLTVTSSNNTICGLTISGFGGSGIQIFSDNADTNWVYACYIGTDPDGTSAIPNLIGVNIGYGANGNKIGTETPDFALKNVISGNAHYGIEIYGTDDNTVVSNFIGTDRTGTAGLGNGWTGVWIADGSKSNTIGSGMSCANIISGHRYEGILINGAGTRDNLIWHNRIGTDVNGTAGIGNDTGVTVQDSSRSNNIAGNLISGNGYGLVIQGAGSDSNRVHGNWIGLDATGLDTLPNMADGICIMDGARYNYIGSIVYEEKNVVSGNRGAGLCTIGDSTAYNTFSGNFSGTDTSGLKDLGNGYYGVNLVGGKGNVVSLNILSGNRCGAMVGGFSEECTLNVNKIGVGVDGETPVPNDEAGIRIQDNATGDRIGWKNQIRFNHGFGVELIGPSVKNVLITQNSIAENDSGGISLKGGANGGISPPVIESVSASGNLTGTATPSSQVEIFGDDGGQGRNYLNSVAADAAGKWTVEGLTAQGPYFTATATDAAGNTSEFSDPKAAYASVRSAVAGAPKRFRLFPNHPNPFNPVTSISFELPEPSVVSLEILDLQGRRVLLLADGRFAAGFHEVTWNATDDSRKPVPSGVYLYRLKAGGKILIRKMTVLK